mmetsp:Transcript_1472/g.3762  ORF Transcript_1472/g.3762 Transcript_1472/m.3762 type:complete len:295 (-) Transcript_1472:418-1302(-)
MADAPLVVMIPLGGVGSRFQKEGYSQPKPFVKVFGTPMIIKVISSLKLLRDDTLVIVYDPEFIDRSLWEPLKEAVPSLALIELPGPTRGAAETVLFGLKGLTRVLRFRPVMLVDGDCFYEEDIVSKYRAVCKRANAVFYFRDTQPKPMYSYIKMDSKGQVTEVKEKVKISHYANTGCYCFMSGEQLQVQCTNLIESNKTQTGALSTHTVGEYYTSGVIANMIEQGATFLGLQVNPKLMYVLGTPTQLEKYCRDHTKGGAIGRIALETRLLLKQAAFDKREGRWVALDNFPDCSK